VRRVPLAVIFLVSLLATSASARPLYGVATSPDLTPMNLFALSTPAVSAPLIIPNDYDAYRENGSASVIVPFYVPFKNGQQLLCDPHDDVAYLYPATVFVEWMLRKFLTDIRDGRPFASPGASVKTLPEYLRIFGTDPRMALRSSTACASGRVIFYNVPAGKYLFLGLLNDYDHATAERADIGYGIAGIPYYAGSHTVDASTYHGTWYTGMVPFTVKAGETLNVPSAGARTFTYEPKRS